MGKCPFDLTRRKFMALTGATAVAAGAAGFGAREVVDAVKGHHAKNFEAAIPFHGAHQAGIVTPAQGHTYFAAFDLATDKRDKVIALLQRWTDAAARMAKGKPAEAAAQTTDGVGTDSGDMAGLSPSRLTVTFGFGPGLFIKDAKDRYGLAAQRPAAFVDLPGFNGDQLVAARTGGDLMVQACAEDPQVAFHCVRQLVRLADDKALIRWTQSGFLANQPDGSTPRNLMGFKDGSANPDIADAAKMDKHVWVGSEGPDWMQGGSYIVARRSRIALEHWDKMKVAFQEQTIGRRKGNGAPLSGVKETDKANLDAMDADGNPLLPENSHIRLATAANNDDVEILRRSYSYNDGVNLTAERWPPWRQGMEYDAGLLFICYQRDPRTGFIKIFDRMAKFDMLNQFVTHVGGGMFAVPAGVRPGEYVGQRLFETV